MLSHLAFGREPSWDGPWHDPRLKTVAGRPKTIFSSIWGRSWLDFNRCSSIWGALWVYMHALCAQMRNVHTRRKCQEPPEGLYNISQQGVFMKAILPFCSCCITSSRLSGRQTLILEHTPSIIVVFRKSIFQRHCWLTCSIFSKTFWYNFIICWANAQRAYT